MKTYRIMVVGLYLALFSGELMAYVGPGAGISLVGALIGLVAAIFVSLWFLLSYPIKKMLGKGTGEETVEDKETKSSVEDGES